MIVALTPVAQNSVLRQGMMSFQQVYAQIMADSTTRLMDPPPVPPPCPQFQNSYEWLIYS